jgi:hypothetical protein
MTTLSDLLRPTLSQVRKDILINEGPSAFNHTALFGEPCTDSSKLLGCALKCTLSDQTDAVAPQFNEYFTCSICMALFHTKCIKQAFLASIGKSSGEKGEKADKGEK